MCFKSDLTGKNIFIVVFFKVLHGPSQEAPVEGSWYSQTPDINMDRRKEEWTKNNPQTRPLKGLLAAPELPVILATGEAVGNVICRRRIIYSDMCR